MCGGNRLARSGTLGHVNEAGLLRVRQGAPFLPVIPDGGADGVLGQHYSGVRRKDRRLKCYKTHLSSGA